jgi:hypothetical protein
MIPIPGELAKRVLEALDAAADDAQEAYSQTADWYVGSRVDRARREAMDARNLRDELAALLAPKEAT